MILSWPPCHNYLIYSSVPYEHMHPSSLTVTGEGYISSFSLLLCRFSLRWIPFVSTLNPCCSFLCLPVLSRQLSHDALSPPISLSMHLYVIAFWEKKPLLFSKKGQCTCISCKSCQNIGVATYSALQAVGCVSSSKMLGSNEEVYCCFSSYQSALCREDYAGPLVSNQPTTCPYRPSQHRHLQTVSVIYIFSPVSVLCFLTGRRANASIPLISCRGGIPWLCIYLSIFH